jgi:hypothetical protein
MTFISKIILHIVGCMHTNVTASLILPEVKHVVPVYYGCVEATDMSKLIDNLGDFT